MSENELEWIRVGRVNELPEGRVMTVTARTTSICLSHFEGQWAAMDNHCPHQGGPLGEGTRIENSPRNSCRSPAPSRLTRTGPRPISAFKIQPA